MVSSTLETVFILMSVVASITAFAVILTAIVFPMMYRRLFMRIVVIISACDVIASSFSAVGFPQSNSDLCPLQAFFTIFGYKSSWFWTAALSYELYSVCLYGKFIKMKYLHFFCWSLSLLTTLLPLTTNGFGRETADDGPSWCFINGNQHAGAIWAALSFQILLFATFFVTVYFIFRIYWRYRSMNISADYPEVHIILDTMILYPVGFFLTWGPNLIFSMLINFGLVNFDEGTQLWFHIVSVLATQSGTVLAAIFFIKSKEARYRWSVLLWGSCVVDNGRSRGVLSGDDHDHDSLNIVSSSSSASGTDMDAPKDFEEEDVFEKQFLVRLTSGVSPTISSGLLSNHSNHSRTLSQSPSDRVTGGWNFGSNYTSSLFSNRPVPSTELGDKFISRSDGDAPYVVLNAG